MCYFPFLSFALSIYAFTPYFLFSVLVLYIFIFFQSFCYFCYVLFTCYIFFLFFRVPEKEFLKAFKTHPRLKTKVNNFHQKMASVNTSDEDFVAIRPEWTTVDRILACRYFGWQLERLTGILVMLVCLVTCVRSDSNYHSWLLVCLYIYNWGWEEEI